MNDIYDRVKNPGLNSMRDYLHCPCMFSIQGKGLRVGLLVRSSIYNFLTPIRRCAECAENIWTYFKFDHVKEVIDAIIWKMNFMIE